MRHENVEKNYLNGLIKTILQMNVLLQLQTLNRNLEVLNVVFTFLNMLNIDVKLDLYLFVKKFFATSRGTH